MLVEMGVLEPDVFKTSDITSSLMVAAYSKSLNYYIAAALSKYLLSEETKQRTIHPIRVEIFANSFTIWITLSVESLART